MNEKDNKTLHAAALKYDGINTPKLVAKGHGALAKEIIDKAREHDIHIHNDPLLIEVLRHLELGDEIPRSLFLAVAKIIAFAYFLQGKHPDFHTNNKAELADSKKEVKTQSNDNKTIF